MLRRIAIHQRRYGSAVTTRAPARLSQARIATAVVFGLLGFLQGTLAARMPGIKDHAQLSDGLLGLALLGMPVGSIAVIQATGRWIARWGSSQVMTAGLVVLCAGTALPGFATRLWTLLPAFIVFGVGMGLTDTAMNAHAVTVEQRYARPIMSSFHGFASLGALAGALGGAVTAHAGLGIDVYFPVAGAVGLAAGAAFRGRLLPASADAHTAADRDAGGHRAPWSRALVLLAAVAFLSLLAELAVGDWSAVYLRDDLGSHAGTAAYGYAFFSSTMLVTRFGTDRLTARVGYTRMLRWGGLIAGAGLALGLLTHSVAGAVLGWGFVGFGLAAVVPIAFTAAGNLAGIPTGGAVSKVAGVGYLGIMVGPPLIGLTAEATSLRAALFVIAAACLSVGIIGPFAARAATDRPGM